MNFDLFDTVTIGNAFEQEIHHSTGKWNMQVERLQPNLVEVASRLTLCAAAAAPMLASITVTNGGRRVAMQVHHVALP